VKLNRANLRRLLTLGALLPAALTAQQVAIGNYSLPTLNSSPWGITSGPDHAMWFSEALANKIGRIATTGAVTEYAIPTVGGGPQGITTGADGALWFTEFSANQIGRITTAGAG